MSEKIKPQHLARKAILYVRQSTAYQVENNLESTEVAVRDGAHLRTLDGAASRSSMRTSGDQPAVLSHEPVLRSCCRGT